VTGVSDLADQTTVKRLELLKAALPHAKRVVLITNPNFPATPRIEARVLAAAPGIGVSVSPIHARDRASLKAAIESLASSPPDALLIGGDALFVVHAQELIGTAASLRIPVAHYWPQTAERFGAILSHQVDVGENYERAASYVDRILKGAKPGDLPIHQPVRYELVVNAKAARMLGIALPPSFLLRADRVVE
jgi:putative ABC transport system substrate-binding protein